MEFIILIVLAIGVSFGVFILTYRPVFSLLATILIIFSCLGFVLMLIRKTIKYCMFPGSFWPFRRTIELSYSREMSAQIYKKLECLRLYLKSIKKGKVAEQEAFDHNSKKLVNTLIQNFQNLKSRCRTQAKTLNLLMNLKVALEHILVVSSLTEVNLWTFIEIRYESEDSACKLVINDENLKNFKFAKSNLKKLLDILDQASRRKNCFMRIIDYFTEYNIGTLDYMRSDLKKRFKCKQVEIEGVDSMFVKSHERSSIAVLICNPNAGFYELTYFQSDWLEFYLAREINVILWNYRGYGLSKGSPDIKDLTKDGVKVLEFYREKYCLSKILLHGESIGGCIAVQISMHVKPDFILADRTFGCLSDVVRFNYGRFCYYLFRVLMIPDCNNTEIFLKLTNYKLISFDPCDMVIGDYISLKSAVATSYILKSSIIPGKFFHEGVWQGLDYILTSSEYHKFSRSLKNFHQKLSNHSKDIENFRNIIKTEDAEDFSRKDIPRALFEIFKELDSCGVSFDEIYNQSEFLIHVWVMGCEIWGSGHNDEVFSKSKLIEELNALIDDLIFITDEKLRKDCRVIIESLLKILNVLNETTIGQSIRTESNMAGVDYTKVGHLQVVHCGHGGQFTHSDRLKYESHLANAGLI